MTCQGSSAGAYEIGKLSTENREGVGTLGCFRLEVLSNMDLFRVGGSGAGCVLPALKGHSACWVESTSGNSCLTLEDVSQARRHGVRSGEIQGRLCPTVDSITGLQSGSCGHLRCGMASVHRCFVARCGASMEGKARDK